MSTKKVKAKKFNVSFDMTGNFGVDIDATSLEEAVGIAREMGLHKALMLREKQDGGWNDFEGHVSAAWEHST